MTINKHYADTEGKDQYTKSFFLEDMPNVNAVSQLAMIELARMKQQGRGR